MSELLRPFDAGGRVGDACLVALSARPSLSLPDAEPWYRYSCSLTGYDGLTVYLERYPVVRRTPCGAWVDDYGTRRFCLHGPGKRFAHERQEDALHSFRRRCIRRQGHARRSLETGQLGQAWAETQLKKEKLDA